MSNELHSSTWIEAIEALKKRDLNKVLFLCDSIFKKKEISSDWCLLRTVALVLQKDFVSARYYLDRGEKKISPEFYWIIYYLSGVIDLAKGSLSEALSAWAHCLDYPNNFKAKELIEIVRTQNIIIEFDKIIKEHGTEYFLPFEKVLNFFIQKTKNSLSEKSEDLSNKNIYKTKNFNLNTKFFISIFIVVIFGILVYYMLEDYLIKKKSFSRAMNLNLMDGSISLNPINDKIVIYKTTSEMRSDFKIAKNALANQKINIARYRIQKILLSNADFHSKEKARLFMRFIPEPENYKNLNSPSPNQISKEPELWFGAWVLYEGVLSEFNKTKKGYKIRLIIEKVDAQKIRESKAVVAFLSVSHLDDRWQHYNQYFQEKSKIGQRTIIFGEFRGIISGKPYIEIKRLWL